MPRPRIKPTAPPPSPQKMLWQGPEVDGVTQSLLGRFLSCRERFRLYVIEGWREREAEFNHRIEYGNMWHLAEEYYCAGNSWHEPLREYCVGLGTKYPGSRESITKYYEILRRQFPIYITYWEANKDVKHREPLLQEVSFKVPLTLPSGRVVLLRGKWDAVDVIGRLKRDKGIYLQENKAKGAINEEQLLGQLTDDLQSMLYLVALSESIKTYDLKYPIKGFRYNVIRRPLGDWSGAFNIKQRKGREVWNPTKTAKIRKGVETSAEFYDRLAILIQENAPHFFMRWKVEVSPAELASFRNKVLDPILEQLFDWYEWIAATNGADPFRQDDMGRPGGGVHYRLPHGVYNPIMEGRNSVYDAMIQTGSAVGLEKVTTLFRELA